MQTFGGEIREKAKSLETSYERGLHSAVESTCGEPVNCRKMIRRPEVERSKWQEGMEKEFQDFEKRRVWKVRKMNEIPPGRRLIGCKWVHELKRNGVCGSRLVAPGHTQMPGVDYQDNFSGMVHDVTLRIGLVNRIVRNLDVDQMGVETAFLEGILEENERVHMKCPPGMKLEKDECLEM